MFNIRSISLFLLGAITCSAASASTDLTKEFKTIAANHGNELVKDSLELFDSSWYSSNLLLEEIKESADFEKCKDGELSYCFKVAHQLEAVGKQNHDVLAQKSKAMSDKYNAFVNKLTSPEQIKYANLIFDTIKNTQDEELANFADLISKATQKINNKCFHLDLDDAMECALDEFTKFNIQVLPWREASFKSIYLLRLQEAFKDFK